MARKFLKRIKKGAFSKQLGIADRSNIPMILINKIIGSPTGKTIRNPSKTGKRYIKVTSLLKKRAVLARNLKNFPRRR